MVIVILLICLPIVVGTAYVQGGLHKEKGQRDSETAADFGLPSEIQAENLPPPPTPEDQTVTATTNRFALRDLFTWRNALLGGLGSFTLLGLSIFGYFLLWTSGIGPVGNLIAQGVFEEGEVILLSSFADQGETGLGNVVTEALRVDLQESSVLNLLAPSAVADAMARMGRTSDEPFSGSVARELSLRDGYKAFIEGEVSAVGGGYLLTAALVAAESGDVLKAFRVPVESENDLLSGIDKLSQDIREKSGESLGAIKRGTPLAQATTGSLDALRLYSEANVAFDRDVLSALPLLEEAVELDPDFAMAWRKIAVVLYNAGLDPARMREASTKAFDLRRRLTEREAGLAEAWYRSTVEDNPEAAIDAYYRLIERYPDEWTAMNNAGVRLLGLGRNQEALEILTRAYSEATSPSQVLYGNLLQAQWNVGQRQDAWATHEQMIVVQPDASNRFRDQAALLAGERRWDEAFDAFEQDVSVNPGQLTSQVGSVTQMVGALLGTGQYARALPLLERAERAAEAARSDELYMTWPGVMRFNIAYALEDSEEAARAVLQAIEETVVVDSLSPGGNGWGNLMSFHALIGNTERSEEMFGIYNEGVAPQQRGIQYRMKTTGFAGFRALGERDYAAAASEFEILQSEIRSCGSFCLDQPVQGIALEGAGRTEEAIAQYEAHLLEGPLFFHPSLTPWTPTVMERLARLYADRGDVARAVEVLESLVVQYSDGDGPFLTYVRRAEERLAELRD